MASLSFKERSQHSSHFANEMPASEEPASQDIKVEIFSENPHRCKSQQEQLRELLNVKALNWICEDEWTMHIQDNSDDDHPRSHPVSIFRVPNVLMKDSTTRASYVPTRVSLGPYHHRSAELPPMNSHKGKAMLRMMTRINNIEFSLLARSEIQKLEEKIRSSYAEKIDCDRNTLALMLSFDGCFILEILRTLGTDQSGSSRSSPGNQKYEPIFDRRKISLTGRDIVRDIMKLENQIPLIVLQKLLALEFNSTDIDVKHREHFKQCMKEFMFYFCLFDLNYENAIDQWFSSQRDEEEGHHILGLVHRFIVSQSHPLNNEPAHKIVVGADEEGNTDISIPRAVELRNAGIKFKHCCSISDTRFDEKSATMFLPRITVEDSTELMFRNLIAFEMCKPSEINYVACYVSLMDDLIDSQEDVALLRGSGIIINFLGSDADVAQLFNGLCNGVSVDTECVFDNLIVKVNSHYRNKVKVQIAELMKEHFSSPWRALALVGAIAILLLTLIQTVFSGLSVRPN